MSRVPRRAVLRVPAVLAVALVLLVAAGCSDDGADRDDEGHITSAGDVSVFDLVEGDCVIFDESLEPEVETMPAVPCDDPHNGEVYALVDVDDLDAYPGERELSIRAERDCLAHFADYVGIDLADSTLFPTTAIPAIRGWQDDGDRTVVCFVLTAGEMVTGTLRDSGR